MRYYGVVKLPPYGSPKAIMCLKMWWSRPVMKSATGQE